MHLASETVDFGKEYSSVRLTNFVSAGAMNAEAKISNCDSCSGDLSLNLFDWSEVKCV